MVGLPLEERDDAIELPVRQAELAMELLFRDGAQESSLAVAPAAPDPPREGDRPP